MSRPKKGQKPTMFATKRQAAAAMGFSVQQMKRDQDAGCTAFKRNGNVHEREYLDWRKAHPELLIDSSRVESMEAAKRRRAIALADQEEDARDEARRNLIQISEIRRVWTRHITAARMKLEAIPRRLRLRIANESDPDKCEAMVAEECGRVVQELNVDPLETKPDAPQT